MKFFIVVNGVGRDYQIILHDCVIVIRRDFRESRIEKVGKLNLSQIFGCSSSIINDSFVCASILYTVQIFSLLGNCSLEM